MYPAQLCDVILVLYRKQFVFIALVNKRISFAHLFGNNQMRDLKLILFLQLIHISNLFIRNHDVVMNI